MLSAFGRAAARKVCVAGSLSIRTAGRLTTPVIPTGYRVVAVFGRGFAAAGAPKKTTTKAATTTAAKKKPAAKKPAKKTAATTTKKKPAAKKAAKPKAKKAAADKPKATRAKTALTDEQKAKLKLKALKERALLKEQPIRLPVTSWNLYLNRHLKETLNKDPKPLFADAVRQLSAEHRALPEHEKEKLELEAQKNKTANEVNLRSWIDSHTAQEIREANTARNMLKRKHAASVKRHIPDPRFPKGRITAYMAFVKTRYPAADLADLSSSEKLAKISTEWTATPPEGRKPYEEIAATDLVRYKNEMDAYRETIQK